MLKAELSLQEAVYRDARKKHVDARERFDEDVKELYKVRP